MARGVSATDNYFTAQVRTYLVLIRFFLVLRCQETPLFTNSGYKGYYQACYTTITITQ